MSISPIEITLGPLFFHWSRDRLADFYARIADEAPVDRVYMGEVVCGKREPLISAALAAAAERLMGAGKTVVWSTLALPATSRERRLSHEMAASGALVELNDVCSLERLTPGAGFVAGPLMNIYNEAAAAELICCGCVRLCGNVELSLDAFAAIHAGCPSLELELFAYGRLPLALSGRCYHARLHGRHKDACQFACEDDPDGLGVSTLEGELLLAMNGVQTLSYGVQVADASPARLREVGVRALRLSPQTSDMVAVAQVFRTFADGGIDGAELRAALDSAQPPGPLVNGYLAGAPGRRTARIG